MKTTFAVFALPVALLAWLPQPVQAQDVPLDQVNCLTCLNEVYYPTVVRHYFPPFGAQYLVGEGHGWHGWAAASGDCISRHGFCPDGQFALSDAAREYLDPDENPLRSLQALIEDYGQRRDLDARLARYPGLVAWNGSRHALQVVDCDGFVVASVPVGPSVAPLSASDGR